MKKIPMIIDCDTGHDDAIAIMLALGNDKVDLRAITTTSGNSTLENTTSNTLKMLSHLGYTDIPVAVGASKFLFEPHVKGDMVHGESGMDGPVLPEPTFEVQDMSAVELIAKTVSESEEKVCLVPMGPIINIAVFILAYPHLLSKIECISFMGGAAFGGNRTAVAEYNTWQDPEAAQIVLSSGIPCKMLGLDVTLKAYLDYDFKEKWRSLGTKAGIFGAELLDFFEIFNIKMERPGPAMHDACAVAYLIAPEIFTAKEYEVTMDLNGKFTRGCTTTITQPHLNKKSNCTVVMDVDREKFVNLLDDAVKNLI